MTIIPIGCVSVALMGGSKISDVKYKWLLEQAAPHCRLVIHPNDRLNTTNAGLTDHKSGKGWKTLLSAKATCKIAQTNP